LKTHGAELAGEASVQADGGGSGGSSHGREGSGRRRAGQ
jgi:hypothetical protein